MYINYKKTFQRLPNLCALWTRMLSASNEYPNLMLVQAEPFLISGECEINYNRQYQFSFVLRAPLQGNSLLWDELLLVERLVRAGSLQSDSLIHLESRSSVLLKAIDVLVKETDDTYARYLKLIKRTN